MKKTIFKGAATAIITPMHPDGSINYDKMKQLIEEQISGHTDAIVVAGTTGESASLSDKEQMELISYTVCQVNHRVPVIAGAGSNYTQHAVQLSKAAEQAGADALLHVTPYYNKASQEGLYLHFKACADAVHIPILLYHIPSRTGVTIQLDTYSRLANIDNIVAVKEASGNLSYMAQLAAACGDQLDLYSGNDDQILCSLALGAKGVISVLSNLVPQDVHDLCSKFFAGQIEDSRKLQLEYLDLISALFSDVNPIPVKTAMNLVGKQVGACRLPLCEMALTQQSLLLDSLKKHGLL